MKIYQTHTDKIPPKARVRFYIGIIWAMELNGETFYGFTSKEQAERALKINPPRIDRHYYH